MIEISPMTKAMFGMLFSVLAIAEYLDKVYWPKYNLETMNKQILNLLKKSINDEFVSFW